MYRSAQQAVHLWRTLMAEFTAMRRLTIPSASATSTASDMCPAPVIPMLATVNQRLGNAERELRVQFTRIAQLQAQLDLVLGALRRSSTKLHT